MDDSLLTIIAARAGSKGLPGKNARRLGDAPLFVWSFLAWREARLPGRCWLSTDDETIAELGRDAGIEAPFRRPAELASDEARAVDVAMHAMDFHRERFGRDPEWYLLLQPTSPLRSPQTLRNAWQWAQAANADAFLGVKTIYRSLASLYHADGNGVLEPMARVSRESRRQDVRPILTPNGALYLIRSEALRRERTFVPPRTIAIAMDAIASIDIDDATDWTLAESIVRSGASWRGNLN